MLFRSAVVGADELERASGWHLRPEGLCRDERCIPFTVADPNTIALADVAAALGAPLVHDARHGLWALGAESGGHVLASATAPELVLPDASGSRFSLASLRGRKVLLVAWASW